METSRIEREQVAKTLRRHGINPTHQRIEIAGVLLENCEHLAAEQILARVNSAGVEASKATVYNTLKLFVERKLVRMLIVNPDRVVYDPNTAPHHHFYDVTSGRLTDIPAGSVRVTGLPSLPPGTIAEGIDVIVRTRPVPEGSRD